MAGPLKVLVIVIAGGFELLSAWTWANTGTALLLLTCPMAEVLETELPSKKTVPPKLCGMVMSIEPEEGGAVVADGDAHVARREQLAGRRGGRRRSR